MIQMPEKPTLGEKSLLPDAPDPRGMDELDGDSAFESAVRAPCPPHAAHAASADLRFDDVRSDLSADQGCVLDIIERDSCGGCQELREPLLVAGGKQSGQQRRDRRIVLRQCGKPLGPLRLLQFKRLVKVCAD
jgi:hypothetical protein